MESPEITPPAAALALSGQAPSIWLAARFGPAWYRDAVREARTGDDVPARCREILFAVCCAESYLLEWVRDEVLKRNFHRLQTYFPVDKKRSILDKWKNIPKELKQDNLITDTPDLGTTRNWQTFTTLVAYRDAIVHARTSRPDSQSQPAEANPSPTMDDLRRLSPGWAVRIVTEQIRALNRMAGTTVPDWLIDLPEPSPAPGRC